MWFSTVSYYFLPPLWALFCHCATCFSINYTDFLCFSCFECQILHTFFLMSLHKYFSLPLFFILTYSILFKTSFFDMCSLCVIFSTFTSRIICQFCFLIYNKTILYSLAYRKVDMTDKNFFVSNIIFQFLNILFSFWKASFTIPLHLHISVSQIAFPRLLNSCTCLYFLTFFMCNLHVGLSFFFTYRHSISLQIMVTFFFLFFSTILSNSFLVFIFNTVSSA